MRVTLAVTAAVLLAAPALGAQQATPPDRRTVVAINPIATVAGFVTGDLEAKVSPSVSLGVGGSAALIDDLDGYGALEGKVRYYPNERALEGFAIAATFGMATARESIFNSNTQRPTYERATRGTLGTEISYQWLLGPRHRFVTVIGAGAKRVIGAPTFVEPLDNRFVPTFRANIGFAF
jgi:hypothetical protein